MNLGENPEKVLAEISKGPRTQKELMYTLSISQGASSRAVIRLLDNDLIKKYEDTPAVYYINDPIRESKSIIRCKAKSLTETAQSIEDNTVLALETLKTGIYNYEELKEKIGVKLHKNFLSVLRHLKDYGVEVYEGANGNYIYSKGFEQQALLKSMSKYAETIFNHLKINEGKTIEDLIKELNIDNNSLKASLKKLEEKALIKKVGSYSGIPNIYFVKDSYEKIAQTRIKGYEKDRLKFKITDPKVLQDEILAQKVYTRKDLVKKYGLKLVKKLSEDEELCVMRDVFFGIKQVLNEPKTTKELSEILNVGIDTVSLNMSRLESKGYIKSMVGSPEKIYYLNLSDEEIGEIKLGPTSKKIYSYLKFGPFQTKDLEKILEMNKNTLLSTLADLREKGFIDSFNASGGENNKYYWFKKGNGFHNQLSAVLALGMEEVMELLSDSPKTLRELMSATGLTKETLLHKIARLKDLGEIKYEMRGRDTSYYLDDSQLFSAKKKVIKLSQKIIMEELNKGVRNVSDLLKVISYSRETDKKYLLENNLEKLVNYGVVKKFDQGYFGRVNERVFKGKNVFYDNINSLMIEAKNNSKDPQKLINILSEPLSEFFKISAFRELFQINPTIFNKTQFETTIITKNLNFNAAITYNYLLNEKINLDDEKEVNNLLIPGLKYLHDAGLTKTNHNFVGELIYELLPRIVCDDYFKKCLQRQEKFYSNWEAKLVEKNAFLDTLSLHAAKKILNELKLKFYP